MIHSHPLSAWTAHRPDREKQDELVKELQNAAELAFGSIVRAKKPTWWRVSQIQTRGIFAVGLNRRPANVGTFE